MKNYNKIILFFAFLFLNAFMVSGQNRDSIPIILDSVKKVHSPIEKVDLYNLLSKKYTKVNTDTFFIFNNKAISLSKESNYLKGLAQAYSNRSGLYFYLDQFDSSLVNLLKSERLSLSTNDSSALKDLYYSLGTTYYFLANYDSAQIHFQESYKLSKLLKDTAGMAKAIKQVGKMQWLKGELAESLKSYNISLPLAKSVGDSALVCVLYNNIGVIYHNVGDYGKALEYYYKTLTLRDYIGDYKGKSLTLNNIGMVYSEWGKHKEAFEYYRHAASLSDSVYYLGGKAYSYYNIGNHYFNENRLDSAIANYKKALATYIQDNSDIIGMYICYSKLGKIYQQNKDLDSALIFFNKALVVAKRMKGRSDWAGANHYLGNLYLEKGDIKKALNYAKKSNEILKNTDYKKMKHLNYALLSEIYRRKKQYKKALEYNILSNQYKDSIFNEEKSKQITQMEVLYRIEQKQKENDYLKKEQERQKAMLKADKKTIRLQKVLVGVITLFLLLVIGFTFAFYKEKQKLKAANNTKNKLFSIISHDLRGPMGNFKGLVDLLILDIENQNKENINSLLQMMQKTAGLNYDLLENLLSWSRTEGNKLDYNPEKLQLTTIVESIFEHYDYTAVSKSIQLINNVDKDIYLMADEYMMNTILRNLISNALKFTKENGKVIISAKNTIRKGNKKYVEICVEDTGIGMSDEQAKKIFDNDQFYTSLGTAKEKGTGLGLKLCAEFVKIHKGEIKAISALNKGTKMIFTIPAY